MNRRGRRGVPPPAPFVVGVGRSGTTLLRLMLDAHPRLAIPAETHFLPELIELSSAGGRGDDLVAQMAGSRAWDDLAVNSTELRERVSGLAHPDATTLLRVFYGLCAEQRGKDRWGDKTPIYVAHMGTILGALPEARFVHLIRDGRDVALSRRARGMGEGKPIGDAARLWKRRIVNARKQARRLRGHYLELRYEDVVGAPEAELRRVCELIELDYEPAMLNYHRGASERLAGLGDLPASGGRRPRSVEERKGAHALAAQPPRADRAGGWRERMSDRDRAEFEAVAGDLLAELGYDVASS